MRLNYYGKKNFNFFFMREKAALVFSNLQTLRMILDNGLNLSFPLKSQGARSTIITTLRILSSISNTSSVEITTITKLKSKLLLH